MCAAAIKRFVYHLRLCRKKICDQYDQWITIEPLLVNIYLGCPNPIEPEQQKGCKYPKIISLKPGTQASLINQSIRVPETLTSVTRNSKSEVPETHISRVSQIRVSCTGVPGFVCSHVVGFGLRFSSTRISYICGYRMRYLSSGSHNPKTKI